MIVTCAEMKEIEERAFRSETTAEELMEQAGLQIAQAIRHFFPQRGTCVLYVGRGHNGGDALVAGRHLADWGWLVQRRHIFKRDELAELTRQKLQEADGCFKRAVHMEDIVRAEPNGKGTGVGRPPVVLLDGLLGIGAKGPLREPIRRFAWEINRLRRELNAFSFAVDIPTGLDGDTGEADSDCVAADFTLTVGFPKRGLLADGASLFVGRLAVLPLPALTKTAPPSAPSAVVATPPRLAPLLRRRLYESHKTNFGKVGILAGSPGFTGAGLMAAKGALRAGAGLVTLFATPDVYPVMAAGAAPEIMVRPVGTYREALEMEQDVLAVGPGLGLGRREELLGVIREAACPMVVDADGLNAIAADPSILNRCAGPRVLTPHPGEMGRLVATVGVSRSQVVERFVAEYPVTLLLKGARTVVGEKGKPISFNSTGNPGMASGGMGDVLTGVIAALMGQKLAGYDAARVGAWVCGRAAEIAIFKSGQSEQSLVATDVIDHLGPAFRDLADCCF
jgi:NAD(P)H-hydrate epimerase